MTIVLDTPYRSTRGRKPSRPAFLFDFHNDAAAGTSVVDRFGNAAAITLQGTLGTSWTASRGFWRPNGTDQQAITGTTNEYAGQAVMADGLLTPGGALVVAWYGGWPGSKNSATEIVLCLGRNNANSASVRIGHGASGPMLFQAAGVGASSSTTYTFGSAGLYSSLHSYLMHLEAVAGGIQISAWLDGVQVGLLNSFSWTANGGSEPTRSTFAMTDGITIAAARVGSSAGSPSWANRLGANPANGYVLGGVMALHLASASTATAQAIAVERAQYRRAIGDMLAGV